MSRGTRGRSRRGTSQQYHLAVFVAPGVSSSVQVQLHNLFLANNNAAWTVIIWTHVYTRQSRPDIRSLERYSAGQGSVAMPQIHNRKLTTAEGQLRQQQQRLGFRTPCVLPLPRGG